MAEARSAVHALLAVGFNRDGHREVPGLQVFPPADGDDQRRRRQSRGSEEIFGPAAPIRTFHSESDAVSLADLTPHGPAGYLVTPDISRVLHISDEREVGMLGPNQGIVSNPGAPFASVKESGLGREGGAEGIGEYL